MGEGCYTISGAPEITVKACRLQNYTDDECADKIDVITSYSIHYTKLYE